MLDIRDGFNSNIRGFGVLGSIIFELNFLKLNLELNFYEKIFELNLLS